jgi:CheY-like chemotaxis protein
MLRLAVISKNAAAAPLEIGEGWFTVGRADGNSLQIVEPSISGRHCEVKAQGDSLLVRDLLSTNGTFVDGKKISEAELAPGQSLRLGDVELRLENHSPSGGTSFISKMLVTTSANARLVSARPAAEEKAVSQKNFPAAQKKFRILFVDDSLAFLDTFGGVCAEHSVGTWDVLTASSADQALALLREQPSDLVVLDIGMPMLDWLQLLGIIARRHPGLKVAVMTGKATAAHRADALANGADLFLEKPLTSEGMKSAFNMLNELVSWSALEGFTGAVRNVGLQEVVQMECNGRHSSILEIRNPELRGQIYIEAGAITHAAVGELTGGQAFYKLMSLRGGQFSVLPFKAPPQRTIEGRWEFLLMDAARVTDEETVLVKKTAPLVPSFEHGEGIVEVTH